MIIEKKIAKMLIETEEKDASELVNDLVRSLTERNLMHLLPAIAGEVKKMGGNKILEESVIIRKAGRSGIDEESIKAKIKGEGKTTNVVEDKDLIAGFKVKFQGKEFDTSARGQVSRFYRALIS